jgi:hypothetical protein
METVEYVLVVKGEPTVALREAVSYGFQPKQYIAHPQYNETVIRALLPKHQWKQVYDWFHRDRMLPAPYPEGSLLWWRTVEETDA